jgi:hypothetical protein
MRVFKQSRSKLRINKKSSIRYLLKNNLPLCAFVYPSSPLWLIIQNPQLSRTSKLQLIVSAKGSIHEFVLKTTKAKKDTQRRTKGYRIARQIPFLSL